ncbi:tyrosine-type recombinase/integrase [Paraburkholderia caledonica]|uniref:tyrosine-type recombinase/integrase n=1 Tax=Paraburkholderia caledonica TaxID=134536 RepID=UPI0038BE1766
MIRSVLVRPGDDFETPERLFWLLDLRAPAPNRLLLFDVPLVAIVVDAGAIVWEPTLFLANQSLCSRSATGDSVRTYSEALLPWLRFLKMRDCELGNATERLLKVYRNELARTERTQASRILGSATIALRIKVVQLFHEWGTNTEAFQSPLGRWLVGAAVETRTSRSFRRMRDHGSLRIAPRAIARLPVALAPEACQRLLSSLQNPYALAFKWSVCTGMRRFEICALTVDQIATARAALLSKDAIGVVTMVRKGGRQLDVHVPSQLLDETWWYIATERPATGAMQPKLFLHSSGRPTSRRALSDAYRAAAQKVGVPSTFHHLRHTFAVTVFQYLSMKARSGEEINPLKTLQVLLGHASVKTSEVYLRALDIQSDSVREALDFLYGGPT